MQVRFHSTTSQWWPLHEREVGMLNALEENRFASFIHSLAETILSGFWKYFPNLPMAHGNGDTLLKVVKQSGFSILRFIGDSMSIQMGQHLACRYERFGVPFGPFSFSATNVGSSFSIISDNLTHERCPRDLSPTNS
jgi:hypothetical protein